MKVVIKKISIVLVTLVPFFWLSWLSAAPGGERVVVWQPGVSSPFVQSPLPAERVSDVQNSGRGDFVTVEQEPVYFAVFPPSDDFTSVDVQLAFDSHGAFAVELGGMTNIAAYAFDFHALSNSVLERLAWHALPSLASDTALMAFAKDDVKASIEDFVAHLPPRNTVVTYRATLPGVYREPSYVSLGRDQVFSLSLRGSHEYVTYIKNEPFHLVVQYQDINRTFGADDGYIRVYDEHGTVKIEEILSDDGNTTEDQMYSSHTAVLDGSGWPEGVYRVEISGTSDIMMRQLVTKQRYMAFKNRMYVGDDVGYFVKDRSTTFVTNSKSLVFETFHADSAQQVNLGKTSVAIPKSHMHTYATVDDAGVVEGRTDAGDIKMTGEGKFAPSDMAFFDPDPRPLTAQTNLADPAIRYVYANLPPEVTNADGWRVATASFSLSSLVQELGAYKFAISLPGFAADEQTIDVHALTVTFRKPSISVLTAGIQELRRWRNALRDRIF